MLIYSDFPSEKTVFVFELDDVIYPKREYLLQIYYLFANFLEFTEAFPPQADLVSFFKNHLDSQGEELIFEHAQETFKFDVKYKENFERLFVNAVLPVKLLMKEGIKELFNDIITADKQICILTKGNPLTQLNKIKHIEWGVFASKLKVYFVDELKFRNLNPLDYITDELQIAKSELIYID
ncbi:HAD hydrolase-like protein [Sphingobacterium sp. SRCM116780]|uniref:HAD hydrolase-like protein n=1 Tax=Sphingobacterium sp. SRCM116780 TaxID=2907623 RepID=UPI001F160F11|nr:HAD hydrolase-like protein [Sphingobacterium sp. SRCM116780]UIR55195.1 HAD hydrolase-like protein [Sphingobacterium sp. SRCM116780]